MKKSTVRLSGSLLLVTAALLGCQPAQPVATEVTPQQEAKAEVTEVKEDTVQEKAVEETASREGSVEVVEVKEEGAIAEPLRGSIASSAAMPETYCYEMLTDYYNQYAILTVDQNQQIVGRMLSTSYMSDELTYEEIEGEIVNGTAQALFTGIENTYPSEWTFDPEEMFFNDERSLQAANCYGVSAKFQEAEGSAAVATIEHANSVRMPRVEFAPGTSSTTVSGSVIRGDRVIHQISAAAGQRMDLSITSTEGNAVFDIVDPSGLVLGTHLTSESLTLPHTGDYHVVVGGTRGNASYDLDVAIR